MTCKEYRTQGINFINQYCANGNPDSPLCPKYAKTHSVFLFLNNPALFWQKALSHEDYFLAEPLGNLGVGVLKE